MRMKEKRRERKCVDIENCIYTINYREQIREKNLDLIEHVDMRKKPVEEMCGHFICTIFFCSLLCKL